MLNNDPTALFYSFSSDKSYHFCRLSDEVTIILHYPKNPPFNHISSLLFCFVQYFTFHLFFSLVELTRYEYPVGALDLNIECAFLCETTIRVNGLVFTLSLSD